MHQPEVYVQYNSVAINTNEFTLNKYSKLIQWKKRPKILDLGSGDGKTTMKVLEPRLPRDYVKLVGSDIQEVMVNYAREQCNNDRIEFVQFNIVGEKLLAEQYDHVFSFFTLHRIDDFRKAFSNIYQLLKPGGNFLVNFMAYSPWFKLIKKLSTYPEWSGHIKKNMFKLQNLPNTNNQIQYIRTILEHNKFTNIKINIEHRPVTYYNWDECAESYLAVDFTLPKLSKEESTKYIFDFCHEIKHVYGEDLVKPDGRIIVPCDMMVVYASKPLDKNYELDNSL